MMQLMLFLRYEAAAAAHWRRAKKVCDGTCMLEGSRALADRCHQLGGSGSQYQSEGSRGLERVFWLDGCYR